MKLTKVGPNRVQSDQGFAFWMKNPFNLHYSEGKREIVVPGEMLVSDKELLISISAIRSWGPRFDREILEKIKKEQITANISAALTFLGVAHEFD